MALPVSEASATTNNSLTIRQAFKLALRLDTPEDRDQLCTAGNPTRKRDLNERILVDPQKEDLMRVVPTSEKFLVRTIFLFADSDTQCPWRDSNPQPFP